MNIFLVNTAEENVGGDLKDLIEISSEKVESENFTLYKIEKQEFIKESQSR